MSGILVKPNQLRSSSSSLKQSGKIIERSLIEVDLILTGLALKNIFEGHSAIALLQKYGMTVLRLNAAPLIVQKFANQLENIADRFEDSDRKLLEESEYSRVFIAGDTDGKAIHPNDVSQGQVGDCYLIASLASLADQNPEAIRKMIKANGDGTFTVTLYVRNEHGLLIPHEVLVNPRKHPGDHVNFADDGSEAWPLLIEKAYAQLYGGYEEIGKGGLLTTALEALSGKESTAMRLSDLSIEQLAQYDQADYAITIESHRNGLTHELYRDGVLVTKHGYYVSDVNPENGTVTIRNPWGWPDSPSESGTNPDTLEITMTFEDFQSNFKSMVVNPGA